MASSSSKAERDFITGALATLSGRLHKDVTLVVYGDAQTALRPNQKAIKESLKRIDYSVRFDPRIDSETAQKLEKLIAEIAHGSAGSLRSDWLTSINDVRIPFRLNEARNAVSDFIEESRRTRNVVYSRGNLTLIAAPLWWTVAIKLHWNGDQDIDFLARVFASNNFFGFVEGSGGNKLQKSKKKEDDNDNDDNDNDDEPELGRIEARATHIQNWLDSNCPRMKPALQSEKKVRFENIKVAVAKAVAAQRGADKTSSARS